ncbi:MAG TPA: PD-(D/E)XK nuclease family protein [Aggregatilineales bacterium]|nr:PD-(D/E)XK nuclease family protein [Aggregatilineales bacterium]
MTKLPPAFEFSQSSLEDYVECARRFELRYLRQQDWPAPPAEPLSEVERTADLGRRFHRLMERHFLDLPIDADTLDPTLRRWWDAFQHNPPPLLGDDRRPEVYTSIVLGGQRISATFDLLCDGQDGVTIVDWKTARLRPTRTRLDRRMQTVVYPLVLVEAAPRLIGRVIPPEQVRLIYWFANAPTPPEIFPYSRERYAEDRRTLRDVIDRILAAPEFPLTDQLQRCRLCQYRSLCDRGRVAGSLDEAETEIDPTEPVESSPLDVPQTDAATEPNEFWL